MTSVVTLIDGFNMYHALDIERGSLTPYRRFKWINYWKLAECFAGSGAILERVILFTAYLPDVEPWQKEKNARHATLIAANRAQGVEVVLGRFLERRVEFDVRPSKLRLSIPRLEEKRTDVNIALALAGLAYDRAYDRAVLVTADSDLIPAIDEARKRHPAGEILVVPPIERHGMARALANAAGQQKTMRTQHLQSSRFPDSVPVDPNSGHTVACPPEWK